MPIQNSTTASTFPPLYKVIGADNRACHGGALDFTTYLPTQNDDGSWKPGAWITVKGSIRVCSRGLHLTDQPAGFWMDGARCFSAEVREDATTDGTLDGGQASKIAVSTARLLAPVAWSDVQVWNDGDHEIRSGYARAWGNATVRAGDNATVRAGGNATVRAGDNATVISNRWHSDSAQVALSQLAAHVDRRGNKVICRVAVEVAP